MSRFLIVCRYVVYIAFCLCSFAYTVKEQMLFTPVCLLLAAAVFAGLGVEEVEKLKK